MTGRVWFYLNGRERMGPVSDEGLRALAASGRLHAESFVWTDGLEAWTRLADTDRFDGYAPPAPPGEVPPAPDRFAQLLLPSGRSPWAVASGYLAALGVLGIPAPLAVAAGIAGLRDIHRLTRATGRRPPGTARCVAGILVGSALTVVLAWLVMSTALR